MKGNTKEKPLMKDYTKPVSEIADNALRNYEQAVRTGLKLQEEAGKWWSSMFNQASFAEDWQKRLNQMTGMANSLVPLAQRRMEEVMTLMEQNSRTGAELVKKAVDAAQTPVMAESQAKWMEFWTSSMGAVRSNAEAVSQISSKTIDSWIDFVRKNSDFVESRISKGA
jgi:hypothetical protein